MKLAGLAALLATAAAVPAAASSYIDSTSSFLTAGSTGLVNATGFDFKPLDFKKSVSVGGITGSSFFGHYGAKATATVGAKFDVSGSLSFTNTVSQLATGQLHTYAGNPFGALTATSGFVLGNTYGASKVTSLIGGGQVDADLQATAFAGATIDGKACFIECTSGNIAKLGIGDPAAFHILGYHSASNSVTFLDKNYSDVLPKSFSSDTLPITATLDAVDVSGTAKGTNGTSFHTSQQVAGAYVDVAKAIVDAFGLPGDVLSGSALGFDYTTVAAKIGAGINAVYDVATNIVSRTTRYVTSVPIQILNQVTGQWVNTIGLGVNVKDGENVIIRPRDASVTSLSLVPQVSILSKVDATMTIDATIEDHIRLLEISGYGLSAGPLYSQDATLNLGQIASFSAHGIVSTTTPLAPLTLTFGTGAAAPLATFASFAAPALGDGTRGFVFVPDPVAAPGDTVAGTIQLALNYGTRECNADTIFGCAFDRDFTPIAEQQRTTRDATGAPVVSYAVDFTTVDRFDGLPDGAFGVQSTPDSLRELLASLPPAGGYDLGAQIADNSTPFMQSVPEPASWAMMVAGFGLVGSLARRRRTTVAA